MNYFNIELLTKLKIRDQEAEIKNNQLARLAPEIVPSLTKQVVWYLGSFLERAGSGIQRRTRVKYSPVLGLREAVPCKNC